MSPAGRKVLIQTRAALLHCRDCRPSLTLGRRRPTTRLNEGELSRSFRERRLHAAAPPLVLPEHSTGPRANMLEPKKPYHSNAQATSRISHQQRQCHLSAQQTKAHAPAECLPSMLYWRQCEDGLSAWQSRPAGASFSLAPGTRFRGPCLGASKRHSRELRGRCRLHSRAGYHHRGLSFISS